METCHKCFYFRYLCFWASIQASLFPPCVVFFFFSPWQASQTTRSTPWSRRRWRRRRKTGWGRWRRTGRCCETRGKWRSSRPSCTQMMSVSSVLLASFIVSPAPGVTRRCWSQSQRSQGEGGVTRWTSHRFIAGPLRQDKQPSVNQSHVGRAAGSSVCLLLNKHSMLINNGDIFHDCRWAFEYLLLCAACYPISLECAL